MPGSRRAQTTSLEEWAFRILRDRLEERGTRISILARPDEENRTTRDVDFLVDLDGRVVAIEVTQLSLTALWWNLLDRLERRIRPALEDPARRGASGWLVVHLDLHRTVSYREVDELSHAIIASILDQLGPSERLRSSRQVLLPAPFNSTIGVTIDRLSRRGHRVSFIKGHAESGGWIEPRARQFVEWLLESKADQTAAYESVWILIVDREVLIDLDDLVGALKATTTAVPPNWESLLLIPATDRTAVLELDITRVRDFIVPSDGWSPTSTYPGS